MKQIEYEVVFVDWDNVATKALGVAYILPQRGDLIVNDENIFRVKEVIHNYKNGKIAIMAHYCEQVVLNG